MTQALLWLQTPVTVHANKAPLPSPVPRFATRLEKSTIILSFACLERIILRWFLVHIHASIPDDILEGSADGFAGEAMEISDKQNILPLERGM